MSHLYAEVDTIKLYQAWCQSCRWYGPKQAERHAADYDRRVHDAEAHRPGAAPALDDKDEPCR